MTQSPTYRMQISLNVLEHLGLNLYSNVPAVLSEVVANAWDADARQVHIAFHSAEDRIEIQDDGLGMTHAEVNERFLTVGFRRRDEMPRTTPRGRAPMGRKGIGKLSLFSIAHQVDVHTVKNGETSAFRMSLPAMRHSIEQSEEIYCPEALMPASDLTCGTRFILTQLQKRHTINTTHALRKRLARRFSVIGAQQDFAVLVNGEAITPSDRDYYAKLQYLWCYGNQDAVIEHCQHLSGDPEDRTTEMADLPQGGVSLSGWIGTVQQSGNLKDDQSGDNLNRIAIYVRGKMAQEDILENFGEGGLYSKYLIGEIHADFLDQDDQVDIATTSRQQIMEDDLRYVALRSKIQAELKVIQREWTARRNESGHREAVEIPQIHTWFAQLNPDQQRAAQKLFGKINQLPIDNPSDKRRLFISSILAFESLRLRNLLHRLEEVSVHNLDVLTEVFIQLDDLEASAYYQTVHERLAVIQTLHCLVDQNAKEKALQQHLYQHLWLLDPSWERATHTAKMEQNIRNALDHVIDSLTDAQKKARLDVYYATTGNKHVIIELKRAGRTLDTHDLHGQIMKYHGAATKVLQQSGRGHEPLEIICVLGQRLRDWSENPQGETTSRDSLAAYRCRIVFYDELIQNAQEAYRDYLEQSEAVGRVYRLVKDIAREDVKAMLPDPS